MNQYTILLRQVHPNFVQDGEITSQVFRPTPKDENYLSMYDSGMITPQDSYEHFMKSGDCSSTGVVGLSVQECSEYEVPVIEDREPFPEHISLNFTGFNKKQIEKKAKLLKARAKSRGWLYKT